MIDVNKTPESKAVLNYTERRIKKNLSCVVIFTGPLGSGKSYSGLRFLELWYKKWLNEKFPIENVVEHLDQAIMKVKDFKRKGEGILIEELSVLASSRASLTKVNRLWNNFLDTCRIKQAVIVGNTPHMTFVDRHIRMLGDIWINTLGVNFKKKIVVCKAFWIQTSPHQPKPYIHKFVGDDGYPLDLCYFKMPNEELVIAYDKRKDKNVNELYDEIAQGMLAERRTQLKEIGRKVLKGRAGEAYELYLKGFTSKECAEKMGLKNANNYTSYLRYAKNKLKQPEYAHFAKEIKERQRKNHFKPPTS